jgi:hypothetical protein
VTPRSEISAYGQIVDCRFDIRNESEVAVFVDRIEFLAGHRREVAHPTRASTLLLREAGDGALVRDATAGGLRFLERFAPLPPGATYSFTIPYRFIEREELVLLTVERVTDETLARTWLPDPADANRWRPADDRDVDAPGDRPVLTKSERRRAVVEAGIRLAVPSPPAPFALQLRGVEVDRWTWSNALDGFVCDIGAAALRLKTANEIVLMPSLPFPLLFDVDHEGSVRVRVEDEVRTITRDDLRAFLLELRDQGQRLTFVDSDGGADYRVEPAK